MSRRDQLRLVGPPGSNKVMAGELSRLVAPRAERLSPGRAAQGRAGRAGLSVRPRRSRWSRSATAAPPRACCGTCTRATAERLEPLYDELVRDVAADQRGWLWDGASFSIRPRNVADFPAAALQLVGAVKNAIIDGARARGLRVEVDAERPDVLLALRRHDDALTVSVDLGGQALHQRGYREVRRGWRRCARTWPRCCSCWRASTRAARCWSIRWPAPGPSRSRRR